MATDITTESVISTSQVFDKVDHFYPRTVVFEFGNDEVTTIAVTLDYLYATTDHYISYKIENFEAGIDKTGVEPIHHLMYTDEGSDPINPRNRTHFQFKFLDTIREMIFKYGLKHEYYKNKYGKWIDVGRIRPYFNSKHPTDNIFTGFFTGTINENILESSIYVKVCDNSVFDCTYPDNYFVKLCQLDDVNKVPAAKYFVKDVYDNTAYIYDIARGDGEYKFNECPRIVFTDAEKDSKDSLHPTNSPRFSYVLANANEGFVAQGDYNSNNSHKCDDLLLTFVNNDENDTPYTDLTNLFVILNGLVVPYTQGPAPNQIYLKDVVKYATIQPKSLVAGSNIDSFVRYEDPKNDNVLGRIVHYDIPRNNIGYHYIFDIKIYKWDNISISNFVEPISTGKILKTVPEETNKSFWLVDRLSFSAKPDKNKCILVCGNTIVDKDSWDVMEDGTIFLKTISYEFDALYAEIYPKMREYLAAHVSHDLAISPKIDDFINQYGNDSEEHIRQAYEAYEIALREWKASENTDNYHHPVSTFDIVAQQFNNRQYAIIKFDNIEDRNFEINVIENKEEIKLNRPMRDLFTNENWSIDDIVVMNGVCHDFINKFENVFFAPDKWYRHGSDGLFYDISAYKLQVVRRDLTNNAFHKLNYTELLYGPIENTVYYRYDESLGSYIADRFVTEFDKEFVYMSAEMKALGFDTHKAYFVKENGNYVRVPSTTTEFDIDKDYYICRFTRDYYTKK